MNETSNNGGAARDKSKTRSLLVDNSHSPNKKAELSTKAEDSWYLTNSGMKNCVTCGN